MKQLKSTSSITRFDEQAIHREAAALRARFFRQAFVNGWKRIARKDARPNRHPKGAAHA